MFLPVGIARKDGSFATYMADYDDLKRAFLEPSSLSGSLSAFLSAVSGADLVPNVPIREGYALFDEVSGDVWQWHGYPSFLEYSGEELDTPLVREAIRLFGVQSRQRGHDGRWEYFPVPAWPGDVDMKVALEVETDDRPSGPDAEFIVNLPGWRIVTADRASATALDLVKARVEARISLSAEEAVTWTMARATTTVA